MRWGICSYLSDQDDALLLIIYTMKNAFREKTRNMTMKTTKAMLPLALAGSLLTGNPEAIQAQQQTPKMEVVTEKSASDTTKVFQTTPDMFVAQPERTSETSETATEKIEKALNDSTNIDIRIFTSAVWWVSVWKNGETISFTEARLGWSAVYDIADWLKFSSKWVVDATMIGKEIIPLWLATWALVLQPNENLSVTWGFTTMPAANGWESPMTIFQNFENSGQKLLGPHKAGTWVKVEYAPTHKATEGSVSAGVFKVKGETEVNASAKYRGVRLTGWKNTKDKHPGWSIGINVGNSSGTFTIDNDKFAWGANIALSPTVTLYGGFTWNTNVENTGKTKVTLSEAWWFKTLKKDWHAIVVATGYNPTTKTLNMYLAVVF